MVRPDWANAAEGPIKVGIATDLTGPIGYAGNADANVARMVVKEINDAGGLLGRPIELLIEDTASNKSVAVGNVRKLIQRDKVDMVLGGITSSMRNAIKDVIVARGKTLYIYPQLYEGKECTPYLFCTGPTPAQQCDEFIPWLIKNGGKRFALPSANYVWPHTLNAYARKVIESNGGEVIFEEYYPLDQIDFVDRQPHHLQQGGRGVQHRYSAWRWAFLQAALRGGLPQERRAVVLRLLRREHTQHQPSH